MAFYQSLIRVIEGFIEDLLGTALLGSGVPFSNPKTNKKLVFGVSYPVNSSSQGVRALHRLSGRHHPGSWKGREQGKAGVLYPLPKLDSLGGVAEMFLLSLSPPLA